MQQIKAHIVGRQRWLTLPLALILVFGGSNVHATLYSYVAETGDYVLSQNKPKNVDEYAVLTDEGEFVRLVRKNNRDNQVPLSHWRPWYLPREPHPFDGPQTPREQQPSVTIDEVEP